MSDITYSPERIVREDERFAITGMPTASWYQMQVAGKAPRPVPISARARGWLLSELLMWIEQRKAERDGKAASG